MKKILLKFGIFFFVLLAFAFFSNSAKASVVYTGPQIGGTLGAERNIHTVNFLGTTIPAGSIDWQYSTSGNFNNRVIYLSIERDGVSIARTADHSISSGSCYPTACEVSWDLTVGTPNITDGDQIWMRVGAGSCSSACADVTASSGYYLRLNSVTIVPSTVALTIPTANENAAGMPSHFQLTAYSNSVPFCGRPMVSYYASGTAVYQATGPGICLTASSSYVFYAQDRSGQAFTGFVTSTPYILSTSGATLITGPTITFYVTNPVTVFTGPVDSNGNPIDTSYQSDLEDNFFATSSLVSVDCSNFVFWDSIDVFGAGSIPWPNISDWFPGSACYAKSVFFDVISWMFVPSVSTNSFLSGSVASFQTIFPFSVFYDVKDIVSGNATSTYSKATSTLSIALTPSSTITFTVGSSTMKQYLGSTVTNYYFLVLRYLLWIMLGISIFAMVKPHNK